MRNPIHHGRIGAAPKPAARWQLLLVLMSAIFLAAALATSNTPPGTSHGLLMYASAHIGPAQLPYKDLFTSEGPTTLLAAMALKNALVADAARWEALYAFLTIISAWLLIRFVGREFGEEESMYIFAAYLVLNLLQPPGTHALGDALALTLFLVSLNLLQSTDRRAQFGAGVALIACILASAGAISLALAIVWLALCKVIKVTRSFIAGFLGPLLILVLFLSFSASIEDFGYQYIAQNLLKAPLIFSTGSPLSIVLPLFFLVILTSLAYLHPNPHYMRWAVAGVLIITISGVIQYDRMRMPWDNIYATLPFAIAFGLIGSIARILNEARGGLLWELSGGLDERKLGPLADAVSVIDNNKDRILMIGFVVFLLVYPWVNRPPGTWSADHQKNAEILRAAYPQLIGSQHLLILSDNPNRVRSYLIFDAYYPGKFFYEPDLLLIYPDWRARLEQDMQKNLYRVQYILVEDYLYSDSAGLIPESMVERIRTEFRCEPFISPIDSKDPEMAPLTFCERRY